MKTRRINFNKIEKYSLRVLEKRLDEIQDITVIDLDRFNRLSEKQQDNLIEEEEKLINVIYDRKGIK